jgi:hypothetical protein
VGISKEDLKPYLNQGSGLLNVDNLVDHFADKWDGPVSKLKTRMTTHLLEIPGCYRAGDNQIAYLPRFRTGATVLQPLPQIGPREHVAPPIIVWLPEVYALWQPATPPKLPVTLLLGNGNVIKIHWRKYFLDGPSTPLVLAEWIDSVTEGGGNAIEITCLDGKQGKFSMTATTLETYDRTEANEVLRNTVHKILSPRRRELIPYEMAAEVLAHGVYHQYPPPLPLLYNIFQPPIMASYHFGTLSAIPKTSPQLHALLQQQILETEQWEQNYWRDSGGMKMPEKPAVLPDPEFDGSYRIRLSLDHYPVSRIIEISANSTFEELHWVIQSTMDWENDHLWVFSFSGKPGHGPLRIGPMELDDGLAVASEFTLGEAGLEKGQKFSYVFDFGDWWVVNLEVMGLMPGVDTLEPTVVAKNGEAPPQYPTETDDEW